MESAKKQLITTYLKHYAPHLDTWHGVIPPKSVIPVYHERDENYTDTWTIRLMYDDPRLTREIDHPVLGTMSIQTMTFCLAGQVTMQRDVTGTFRVVEGGEHNVHLSRSTLEMDIDISEKMTSALTLAKIWQEKVVGEVIYYWEHADDASRYHRSKRALDVVATASAHGGEIGVIYDHAERRPLRVDYVETEPIETAESRLEQLAERFIREEQEYDSTS